LIVGAGPAGLTLAAALARLGVDHVVVEPHECVMPGSKAAGMQPRALECLDRLGVADHVITDGGSAVNAARWTSSTRTR
jgi:2-polyprenyl-6-methoxyphenol hydroxylase-like FAD-dependent oxidoreductase